MVRAGVFEEQDEAERVKFGGSNKLTSDCVPVKGVEDSSIIVPNPNIKSRGFISI